MCAAIEMNEPRTNSQGFTPHQLVQTPCLRTQIGHLFGLGDNMLCTYEADSTRIILPMCFPGSAGYHAYPLAYEPGGGFHDSVERNWRRAALVRDEAWEAIGIGYSSSNQPRTSGWALHGGRLVMQRTHPAEHCTDESRHLQRWGAEELAIAARLDDAWDDAKRSREYLNATEQNLDAKYYAQAYHDAAVPTEAQ